MMGYRAWIEVNPKVMVGKPVIRGTRITVETILEQFAAGYTEDEILQAYPHLTREAIRAALAYAADVLRNEELILAGTP